MTKGRRFGSWSRPVRRALTGLAVLVIAFAVTVTAYRTLKPADTVTTAAGPLPSPSPIKSIQYGELDSAPLIVEGSVRVYAEQRRVFADTPVTASRTMTPRWSLRRWPAEVVSVAAVEKTALGGNISVVITKWSDGAVVATNAITGVQLWQSRIEPASGETYQGRLTGEQTVWDPQGLFTTASAATQRPIVVVTGKDQAVAFDPWTGATKWAHAFPGPPDCHNTSWTGLTTYLVKDTCSQPANLEIYDAESGAQLAQWRPPGASIGPPNVSNWYVQPASCQLGHSSCALFKAAATGDVVGFTAAAQGLGKITPSYYQVAPTGVITPQPYADKDTVFQVGDTLIEQVFTNYVWAVSATSGQRRWMSEVAGSLIGADPQNAYIINDQYQLLVLNLVTGAVTSSTELRIRPDDTWVFKSTYLHDGYLAVERLQTLGPESVDDRYYFSPTPVVLVGVT
jgi:outer membrane protein assembly factor BamB